MMESGKDRNKDNIFVSRLKATEPTIWALRRNTSNQNEGQLQTGLSRELSAATLYEHLFGYDPIRLLGLPASRATEAPSSASRETAATNPRLQILNPATSFTVSELASDLPPDPS